jgi:cytochrome c-type biogenesis protein CcmE
METTPRPVSGKRRAKFLVGGSLAGLIVIGLIMWATTQPGATSFYMTTSELVAVGSGDQVRDLRVNGKVVPGSIDQQGLATTFLITDGSTEMTVTTDAPLPDTFRERSDVVAEGAFNGDVFVAGHVTAKCPSKFKAKA